MPHTVRRAGCATMPASKAANVPNVGAVKQGRNTNNNADNDPGRVCN